jgi:hypothetical protein
MKVPFNIEFSLKRSIRAIATAVFAVVLTSGAAFAQEDGSAESSSESKLMIGFKSGINLSDIRTGSDTDYFDETSTGKNFGPQIHAFVRYDFTKWVGAELELGWTQNSFNIETGRTNTFRTNNFQANALMNVRIPAISVYHPRFFFGPSYNYNAYSYQRMTGASEYGPYNIDQTVEVTNLFNGSDFGVIVGAGLQFDLKFANLLLDARYRHGITQLRNTGGISTNALALPNSFRMSDFAITAGLGFSL